VDEVVTLLELEQLEQIMLVIEGLDGFLEESDAQELE